MWNHRGVAILIQDAHIDFATDFANVVLRNFIEMCKQQAIQAQKKAADTKLIVEG